MYQINIWFNNFSYIGLKCSSANYLFIIPWKRKVLCSPHTLIININWRTIIKPNCPTKRLNQRLIFLPQFDFFTTWQNPINILMPSLSRPARSKVKNAFLTKSQLIFKLLLAQARFQTTTTADKQDCKVSVLVIVTITVIGLISVIWLLRACM